MENNMLALNKNNIENILSLTPVQEGILYHYLLDREGNYYLEQLRLSLAGTIREDLFKQAWTVVVNKNEMLRTVFRWEKLRNPVQIVLKQSDIKTSFIDLSDKTVLSYDIDFIIEQDIKKGFDLKNVPFRITLCKFNETKYIMIITHHHILYDGWSTGIILKEFFDTYYCLVENKQYNLSKKRKYHDYIKWLKSKKSYEMENYWTNYLRGYKSKPFLYGNHSYNGRRKSSVVKNEFSLTKELYLGMLNFASINNVTMATILYSAWGILLFQYCNEEDVSFGTTVAIRPTEISGIENSVGLFINTVPLRIKGTGDEMTKDYILKVNSELKERKEYESASLVQIKDWSELKKKEELFQSIFVVENYPIDSALYNKNDILSVENYSNYEKTNYDFTVVAKMLGNSINISFLYNTSFIDCKEIKAIENHYCIILHELIDKSHLHLKELSIVSAEERIKILKNFNSSEFEILSDLLIHQVFEKMVLQTPEKIAVVFGDKEFTYNEINIKSNKLARHIANKGIITKDSTVGILVYPSVEMIVGILAILKIGGAYVPLDPANPQNRNLFIIEDADIKLLLTTSELIENFSWSGQTVIMEDDEFNDYCGGNLQNNLSSSNLAYIIYTSGSTGNPKGVMIEHKSVVNILSDLERRYPIDENDTYLLKTTYTFDVSVTEIFGWFFGKGRLAILEKGLEKDPNAIISILKKYNITHLNLVPSMFRYFLECLQTKDDKSETLNTLKYIFMAGEALKPDLVEKFNDLGTSVMLENIYGPTESTIYSSCFSLREYKKSAIVPIGKPMANIHCYIIDKHGRLQPVGIPGELCLSGAGLSRGYRKREELTSKVFCKNPFYDQIKNLDLLYYNLYNVIYKTGDLARWLPDGNIEYLGRSDYQVKIRGLRIELEEVENELLKLDYVREAVIIPKDDGDGNLHLIAYYTSNFYMEKWEIIKSLSLALPSYMIPAQFIKIDKMPVTSSGKVDRKALPDIEVSENELVEDDQIQYSDIQQKILMVWKEVLQLKSIGINQNFFDVGGNSLNLIRVNSKINEMLEIDLPLSTMFQYPTIYSLANHLTDTNNKPTSEEAQKKMETEKNSEEEMEIAIIGMAGRFPQSINLDEFWENIKKGNECITFFSEEELLEAGVDCELVKNSDYVNAQGVMQDIDCFDADFFGYSPREAEIMDPQVRVLHEVVWEALENSGYCSYNYQGEIGIFSCASPNLFWEALVAASGKTNILGILASEQLFNKDYMSTRIAYKLNLTGPAVSVYTACSSSLVSIHNACESLIRGECQIAIAGSSTISPLPDKTGYLYQEGMVKSTDGHCRAFDINGSGFVGGTGAAAVVLKRKKEALRDRDSIVAVIKASAINNDGSNKAGYTAPSVEGQKKVVQKALQKAGISCDSVGYIEAHGTATPLGDLVEIEALKQAFNDTGLKNYCGIGSVKSNIGHLDCTAGIAGFIKTALILKNKLIPPSLNLDVANPKLNLIDSPFYVVTEPTIWDRVNKPLIAGVSSLGLGGTNVHIILEEPPLIEESINKSEFELILISGKTQNALANQIKNLHSFLKDNIEINLSDVAYTLKTGRQHMEFRSAFVCKDINDAIEKLEKYSSNESCCVDNTKPSIILNLNLLDCKSLTTLIRSFIKLNVFYETFKSIAKIYKDQINFKYIELMKRECFSDQDIEAYNVFDDYFISFCAQYSIVKTLIAFGLRPVKIYGDMIGELAAIAAVGESINTELFNLIGIRLKILKDMQEIQPSQKEIIKQLIGKMNWNQGEVVCFSNRMNNSINSKILKSIEFWTKEYIYNDLKMDQKGNSIIINLVYDTTHLSEKAVYIIREENSTHLNEHLLNELCKLWLSGSEINWDLFYENKLIRRISLPTYPFEKQKYWIEGNPFNMNVINKPGRIEKNTDMSQWFYVPVFVQSPLNCVTPESEKIKSSIVFTNTLAFNEKLMIKLERQFQKCIKVLCGTEYKKINDYIYEINIADESDYIRLFENFDSDSFPEQVISLLGITGEMDCKYVDLNSIGHYLDMGYFNLLYMTKAIIQLNLSNPIKFIILTDNIQPVSGDESINPAKSTVLGLCKVIPQEISFIDCKSIDICIPKRVALEGFVIDSIISELLNDTSDTVVAIRNRHRYLQSYHKQSISKISDTLKSTFKRNGTYLITGGLGNIGLALAEYLSKKYKARLILISLSEFPNRDQWGSILAGEHLNSQIAEKIKKINEMEDCGAQVKVYSGDISNFEKIDAIIKVAEEEFGNIDGVIHAAGAMRESLYMTIEDLGKDESIKQFMPKIQGLMVLYRIFKNKSLDFLTVTSSTSSILGGLGFGAYSAANMFMDYFIREINRSCMKSWLTVNWEGWKFERQLERFGFQASLNELFMEPKEGVEVFERVTNTRGLEQVVVSSGDLTYRINQWIYLDKIKSTSKSDGSEKTKKPRPNLKSEYVMATNKMQQTIVTVFQNFFGYEEIGIDDNFFDLGASSLDMIQIINNLRKTLNTNIPILKLFTNPTIRTLTDNLNETENNEQPKASIDRSKKLSNGRSSIQARRKLRKNKD